MALLLNQSYDTPAGFTVNSTYWRWVGLGIDVTTNQATALLYAYVSEDAYTGGKQNIGQRQYTVSGAQFNALVLGTPNGSTLSDAISNAIYAYVLANDSYFAGATQV